jgi:hypothetical protein
MFSMWNSSYSVAAHGPVLSIAERTRRAHPGTAPSPSARFFAALDALIHDDAVSTRLERRIAREQRRLRRLTTNAAWTQYLRIESAQMDRSLRWLELAASLSRRKR